VGKVIKAPDGCPREFFLGYRHWKVEADGTVKDLSPDDRQFFELQRLFGLVLVDELEPSEDEPQNESVSETGEEDKNKKAKSASKSKG